MVTADNALVYGHPLSDENWIANQYGLWRRGWWAGCDSVMLTLTSNHRES
jgi:hypothetical protein